VGPRQTGRSSGSSWRIGFSSLRRTSVPGKRVAGSFFSGSGVGELTESSRGLGWTESLRDLSGSRAISETE
jgi:hypothetical protein